MTPPIQPERSPAEYLQYLRQTNPERAKAFEAFLVERGQPEHIAIADRQERFRSGEMQRDFAAQTAGERAEDVAMATPVPLLGGVSVPAGAVRAGLETAATVARGFPGGRLAQQGMAQLGGSSPEEARAALDAATTDQGLASVAGQMAGAGPMGAAGRGVMTMAGRAVPAANSLAMALADAIGRSGAKSGAVGGFVDQMLTGDEAGLGERAARGTLAAALGAGLGGVAERGIDLVRQWRTPAPDVMKPALLERARASARPLYKQAEQEGMAWAASPGVGAPGSFAAPDIEPLIATIKAERQFAGATDDAVLREAYRRMSRAQRQLGKQVQSSDDPWPADVEARRAQIGLQKEEVLQDADVMMPSFRKANEAMAKGMQNVKAFEQGVDATQRLVNKSLVPGPKLEKKGRQAFLESIKKMPPEQAEAAKAGVMGRSFEMMGPNIHVTQGFGLVPTLAALHRTRQFIRPLDAATGTTAPKTLRDALLAGYVGGTP